MTNSKKKILLLIKVPPPVTGATLMNSYVLNSKTIADSFDVRSILISYSKTFHEQGSFKFNKIVIYLKTIRDLIKEIASSRPDIVYFQISPLGLVFYRDALLALIVKLFNVKLIYHLHGKGIKAASKKYLNSKIYKFVFGKSDVICLSKLLVYDIEDVTDGKIHTVNNGIPLNEKANIVQYQNDPLFPIRILFLSNLLIEKGIEDFVESLAFLKRYNVPFVAQIVGAEKDYNRESLLMLIRKYGVEKWTTYLGAVYDDEKFEIIRNCDVLVHPTLNDAHPNVILEAMQFGKVVISTNEGAIPEIIKDKKTGFIIDRKSPSDIASKIKILGNDRGLLYEMGKLARERFMELYTLDKFEAKLVDVLNESAT